ncbi:MAG: 3-dehydroquinate synthase family protein [Chloroflexota bacterium]
MSGTEAPKLPEPCFGRGTLRRELARVLQALEPAPSGVFVVLDRGAAKIARAPVEAAVRDAGLEVRVLAAPHGEARKTWEAAGSLVRSLVRAGCDRRALVLGVGGGVCTDLAGFAAALIGRGVRWGACPTTLLGMADAALGGKTAVNLPEGKNLAGAFHFPEFVIADTGVLRTLPEREWSCGLGEVVKSAMLEGEAALGRLERAPRATLRRPSPALLQAVRTAAALKMKLVRADPREKGERALLNLGHTFGHALETSAGARRLAHGEAVALGLLVAVRLSARQGLAAPGYADRVEALLARCGLPLRYPGVLPSAARLTALLARDKKASSRRLDLILPLAAGHNVIVSGVAPAEAARAIRDSLPDLRTRG